MRILQVVKTNDGAKWAFTQAEWLKAHGVEVVTVLPSLNTGMSLKYQNSHLKVIQGDFTLPIRNPLLLNSKVEKIKRIVEEVKPDIIHCHFVTNIMMFRVALRNSNIPRLFQVPGPLHLESIIFRLAEIGLANKNDYWAGACKKTCDIYLKNGVSKNHVFLAYYGGYGGVVTKEYNNSNKLHSEFNISEERKLVGMVSYFYKPKYHLMQKRGLKGHEDFIDAIKEARKEDPNILGIIIGDAWANSSKYVEKVKAYANLKCKDGIIFTGFRTDIKDIYKELDIAVHPSHSENLGGAAESLAAGVPTITTNVGGFPDIIIDGKTGFMVPKKSSKELARAIIKMAKNKDMSLEMAYNGKKLVSNLLDIENTGKEILNIYNKILTGEKYV